MAREQRCEKRITPDGGQVLKYSPKPPGEEVQIVLSHGAHDDATVFTTWQYAAQKFIWPHQFDGATDAAQDYKKRVRGLFAPCGAEKEAHGR